MSQKISFILIIMMLLGCASIVSKSKYPISLTSSPSKADVAIRNRKGESLYNGTTPAVVSLSSGESFFRREEYEVTFSKEGYPKQTFPVKFGIDGWYFGNVLFGGFIGFLIVDPLTGAMHKLKTEFIVARLDEPKASNESLLNFYDINAIPEKWKPELIPVNQSGEF